ncbi:MAG: serine/threonine-protein kinase [Planctomycetota bacterium]
MKKVELHPVSGDERLKELLDELLDLPLAERDARLAELAGDDPDFVHELRVLLDADEAAGDDFLTPVAPPRDDDFGPIPEFVGPYRIEGVLGRGGMACVFRGRQREPIEREVAVKILRPEITSPQILKRFEAERHVLARLEHPGIARVLDAGAEPYGPAYFVMELVDGPPITEYAIRESLPLSRRIELAIEVCRAVQHAHGRGILHRDLKPSNILVACTEDGPQPKVIDFGVAKALERDKRLVETELTQAGQLIGTLEYMSPEQAGFGRQEVDTRSDVFSMGVVLYELIADRRPLDLEGRNVSGLSKFLRALETQDPAAPSSRDRCALPVDLSRAAINDLDCVVRRALEREPHRRYPTMNDLADDLRRVLDGAPVEARPPTRTYLLSRYARRNRVLAGGVLAVFLSLFLGVIGTSYGLVRALEHEAELAEALDAAEVALLESDQATLFLSNLILLGHAERGDPEMKIVDVLETSGRRLLENVDNLAPAVRGQLASSVGVALLDARRLELAPRLLELAAGELEFATASDVRLTNLYVALNQLALYQLNAGETAAAEQTWLRTIEALDVLEQRGQDLWRVRSRVQDHLASVFEARGDSMRALELQRATLEGQLVDGTEPRYIATTRSSLAMTLTAAGEYAEAEQQARKAHEIRTALYDPFDFRVINATLVLGSALTKQGRVSEAFELLEQASVAAGFEPGDPRGVVLEADLALLSWRLGQNDNAEEELAALVVQAKEAFGEVPRVEAAFEMRRLEVLARSDPEAAVALAERQVDQMAASNPDPGNWDVVRTQLQAGQKLYRGGHPELARPFLESALAGILERNSSRPRLADEVEGMLAGTE